MPPVFPTVRSLFFAFFLGAALLAHGVRAAPPHTLAVQGRLEDPAGEPLTGTATLTMRIHDAATAGNVDFSETEVVALSDDGTFSAILGDDAAALDPGLFAAARWLSLEVDGGGELSPRTALVPAPYALNAVSAEGLAPSTTVDLGGEILTGLPAPTAAADAATKAYVDAGDGGVQADLDAHTGDADIHFTAGSLAITASQVSDFDTAVSTSTHAGNAAIHFTQGSISITSSQVSDFDAGVTASSHAASSSNPHAVSKTQVGLGNVQDLKVNLADTVAPKPTDDTSKGYAVGSTWIDNESQTAYLMSSHVSLGKAGWRPITGSRNEVRVVPVYSGGSIDAAASGTALSDALAAISDNSASNRYVVHLAPGAYRVGGTLTMKAHVSLVGAGPGVTVIEGDPGATDGAILLGADAAHLADLTVRDHDAHSGFGLRLDSGEARVDRVHIEMSFGTRGAVFGNGGNLRIHDSRLLCSAGASVGVIRHEGGQVSLHGCEVEAQAGTSQNYGVRQTGASPGEFRMVGGEVRVTGGATDTVYGLDIDSGTADRAVIGTAVTVTGSTGTGILIDGGNFTVSDCSVRVDSLGSGSIDGINLGGTTEDVGVVAGCSVRVSTGGTAEGINSSGVNGGVVTITGNSIRAAGGTTTYGIDASAGETLVSGNSIRVIGGSATTIGLDASSDSLASGNRIYIDAAPGTTTYGLRSSSGSTLDGNTVEINATGANVYGVYSNSSTGLRVKGGKIFVSGTQAVWGIFSGVGICNVTGASIEVSGDVAIGVDSDDGGLIASGIDLEVQGTGSTDAVGIRAEPNSTALDPVVVSGSYITVGATSASGYLGDVADAAKSPDLRVFSSEVDVDLRGTDVSCTDTFTCP